MEQVSGIVHYHCVEKGGYGAFREFEEWLIHTTKSTKYEYVPRQPNQDYWYPGTPLHHC